MFLIDDLLLFPVDGLMMIFREINNATQEELTESTESVTAQLTDLYMMLETGRITDEEFELREKELLDILDSLEDAAKEEQDKEGQE
jgi:Gas vesicle protein G